MLHIVNDATHRAENAGESRKHRRHRESSEQKTDVTAKSKPGHHKEHALQTDLTARISGRYNGTKSGPPQTASATREKRQKELGGERFWRRSERSECLRGRNVCRCKRCGRKRYKFRRDPKRSQKKNVSVDGNLFEVVAARHGARVYLAGMVSVVAIHRSPARLRGGLRRGMMISVDRALLAGAAGAGNGHQGGTGHGSVHQQQRQQAKTCPGRAHSRICRFFHGSIDLPIIRQVPAENRAEVLARRTRDSAARKFP